MNVIDKAKIRQTQGKNLYSVKVVDAQGGAIHTASCYYKVVLEHEDGGSSSSYLNLLSDRTKNRWRATGRVARILGDRYEDWLDRSSTCNFEARSVRDAELRQIYSQAQLRRRQQGAA